MVSNLMVVLCGESEVHPGSQHRHALHLISRMASRKPFLLRIDPELWIELEAWAGDELRSVNGQIEYLLRQAVSKRKGPQSGQAASRRLKSAPTDPGE